MSAKELDFDENNKHVNYDVVPIIKATEASGYKGIYSIEFYGEPPKDVVGGGAGHDQGPVGEHQRVDSRAGAWMRAPLRFVEIDSLSFGLTPAGSTQVTAYWLRSSSATRSSAGTSVVEIT